MSARSSRAQSAQRPGSAQDGRNLTEHRYQLTPRDRMALNGHRACVLWLTGLSGSGKSTIANDLAARLHRRRVHTQVLDGDNVRLGLNADLGFSPADRKENIRRVGEVARLSVEAGLVVIAAFISPYRADRDAVRRRFAPGEFVEIYVDCPLEVCRARDPKGFYRKVARKKLSGVTGVNAPFEAPLSPELTLHTDEIDVEEAAGTVVRYLESSGVIARSTTTPPRRPARPTRLKEPACS